MTENSFNDIDISYDKHNMYQDRADWWQVCPWVSFPNVSWVILVISHKICHNIEDSLLLIV